MSPTEQDPVVDDLSLRRLHKLEAEHQELKAYVADMMQRLHENDQLFAKLSALEAKVLAAVDMESFCFVLLRELRSHFDLDLVRLWLDGGSFMGRYRFTGLSKRDVVWVDAGSIEQMRLTSRDVWLLDAQSVADCPWISERDSAIQSMAMLVLGRGSDAFAVLGLGSKDDARFSPDQAADFLHHLAQVIGVALENSFVREQVARLSVTDHITSAFNQRFFQPHSEQVLSKWFGKGVAVSCLYLGVTGMTKTTRETVLKAVDAGVRSCVRVQDTVIRMDDDAFLVFLAHCPAAKAEVMAQRMVAQYEHDVVALNIGVGFSAQDVDKQVKHLVEEAKKRMLVAQALEGRCVEGVHNHRSADER